MLGMLYFLLSHGIQLQCLQYDDVSSYWQNNATVDIAMVGIVERKWREHKCKISDIQNILN